MLSPDPVHKPCPTNMPAHIEPLALLAVSGIVKTLHAKPKQMTQKLPKGPFIIYYLPFSVFCLSHTKLWSSDVSKTLVSYTNRLFILQITSPKKWLHFFLSCPYKDISLLKHCFLVYIKNVPFYLIPIFLSSRNSG